MAKLQRGDESANRARPSKDRRRFRKLRRIGGAPQPGDNLQVVEGVASLFADRRSHPDTSEEALKAELYQQIGQLQVELDWLKEKVRPVALEQRRGWIGEDQEVSIRPQCRLAGISRSGWYYQAQPETAENLHLMRWLDEQYTRTPFYGVRKMTKWFAEQGYPVNAKRGAPVDATGLGHNGEAFAGMER